MKKIKTFTRGDAISPPLTTKQGPISAAGMHHTHYELSPFTKQSQTHGTFDVATKKKIDRKQKSEMDR
jgi:hypothetical protein